jgi:hypothetical protein
MQIDYLKAWLEVSSPSPMLSIAPTIAAQYTNVPDQHWNRRFADLRATLQEINQGMAASRSLLPEADSLSSLSLQDGSTPRHLVLHFHNINQVTFKAFEPDVELLFSQQPFGNTQRSGFDGLTNFSYVTPRATRIIKLDEEQGDKVEVSLDAMFPALACSSLLLEVSGGGLTRTLPRYGSNLSVRINDSVGLLTVMQMLSSAVVVGAYVKVFVRSSQGEVKFHKDGYTDRRGKFDYAATTSSAPFSVAIARFAILVVSDEFGAIIEEVDPPLYLAK